MRRYIIDYRYSDGFEGEVEVQAESRSEALGMFESFASEDIVTTDCTRVEDEEEE